MKTTYSAIGLMSGTSLDGLDLAYCRFTLENFRWQYHIEAAETLPYPEKWRSRLDGAWRLSGPELMQLHVEYGHYIGQKTVHFIQKYRLSPNLVASHGHTAFHQPERGFTLQVGEGAAIASYLDCPLISDFRSMDVALGGQGAPLVPVGDALLFPDYAYCLNLGGIANISYPEREIRVAYDICPVNMALDHLADEAGKAYDENGAIAAGGRLDPELLQRLNAIAFYRDLPPKSLGKEWFERTFLPVMREFSELPLADRMQTAVEHAAMMIARACKRPGKLLLTGGGAFNEQLVNRIKTHSVATVIVPDAQLIAFKEALIFAFLGVLRLRKETNCLASVTGASADHIGGAIYFR